MKFHISTVLSITTGRLVSVKHMDGVYEICDGLTGVSHMTHQLPRVARELEPFILEQHPQLKDVVVPDWSGLEPEDVKPAITLWLETDIYPTYGEELDIEPMVGYQSKDPLNELAEMAPHLAVIPVIVDHHRSDD